MVKPWVTQFLDQFAQLANSYDHAAEYELVEDLDPEGPTVANGTLKDLEFMNEEAIDFELHFGHNGNVIVTWWEASDGSPSLTTVTHPKAAFGLLYL